MTNEFPDYDELNNIGDVDDISFMVIYSTERYLIPDEVVYIDLPIDGTAKLPEHKENERFILEYFHPSASKLFGRFQVNDDLGLNYLISQTVVQGGRYPGLATRLYKVSLC
jgi:hypothetical protein